MPMPQHPVVSREQWLTARKALLAKEKEATHLRDQINAERLALPWVNVAKEYIFETPLGKESLAELFAGRSQLVVYHFMLGPGWATGCPGCSFVSDHLDGALQHLAHHDVTLMVVSRAPLGEIAAYQKRMGWMFPWVSAFGSDFNFDYQASVREQDLASGKIFHNYTEQTVPAHSAVTEAHAVSAFYKDENGEVFHTYSNYARGHEEWIGTLMILDCVPKGRNETKPMDFVRRHDEYDGSSRQRVRGVD
jgi:predicted dithiol-disulfide oxidoreductase (DUF899 family)